MKREDTDSIIQLTIALTALESVRILRWDKEHQAKVKLQYPKDDGCICWEAALNEIESQIKNQIKKALL